MMATRWLRMGMNKLTMTVSDLTTTPLWLAGQDPAITVETFMAWCCFRNGLCQSSPRGGPGGSALSPCCGCWSIQCQAPE